MALLRIMLTTFWRPALLLWNFLKMVTAIMFLIPFAILRIATKGPKSLARYDKLFEFLSGIFLGKFFFANLIGAVAPYSATIGAQFVKVSREEVIAVMPDRPWLHNPFNSLHAIALANLGELASGMAWMTAVQYHKGVRGIPVKVECEYYKKARGTITAVGKVKVPEVSCDLPLAVEMTNGAGEVVCKVTVTWRVQVVKKD